MTGAEASLERALELAEPEGVLLPFVLVRVPRAPRAAPRPSDRPRDTAVDDPGPARRLVAPGRRPALLDPLSDAELRVVRYLPGNLKAPEIHRLFVSPNTVRTHLRHIYAKLDVHTRGEAVTRARQLRLLAPA